MSDRVVKNKKRKEKEREEIGQLNTKKGDARTYKGERTGVKERRSSSGLACCRKA